MRNNEQWYFNILEKALKENKPLWIGKFRRFGVKPFIKIELKDGNT